MDQGEQGENEDEEAGFNHGGAKLFWINIIVMYCIVFVFMSIVTFMFVS